MITTVLGQGFLRTTESLRLAGTFWYSLVQAPYTQAGSATAGCPGPCPPGWEHLHRDSTASLGKLFWCFTTLTNLKIKFLKKWNPMCFHLWLLPFGQSQYFTGHYWGESESFISPARHSHYMLGAAPSALPRLSRTLSCTSSRKDARPLLRETRPFQGQSSTHRL